MTQPRVEVLPIEQGATTDINNVNKHTAKGGAQLENSLRKRGAFRSIASAGKDTETPVVYAGNYTLEKAVDAGFTEIINVHVSGHQLVNVVRDDIAPGTPEAVALGIEDNEIGKNSYSPDIDILAALTAGDTSLLSALRREDAVLNSMIEHMTPQQIDYEAEWEGMPEFEQEDLTGFRAIHIHFQDQAGVDRFAELIGQKITDKTRALWYPPVEKIDMKSEVYTDEL